MLGQRKQLKTNTDHIKRIIDLYTYMRDFIVSKSSNQRYDETLKYLESIVEKSQNDYDDMPIGYEYVGIFYLRKVNDNATIESIKVTGLAFLREDVISWKLTSDNEYAQRLYYAHEIYKDKSFKQPIQREDCIPVFKKDY
ncbi:hypothetical protein [Francisella sp. SYW-9]|uniref:hypothetical protein n=1 Tax=Francisella sp. SYW-9 TaxID=2610888 RepID=UPI00123D6C92|nr:hypothetical protein [Francisella sp. SYW-9]